MKKLFLIAIVSLFTMSGIAQNATPRIPNAPQDNTGRNLTFAFASPTLAATDSIAPNSGVTYYKFVTIAGAKTITCNTKRSRKFDKVEMIFTADGTNRVVTFSTGFIPNGTMTVAANKQAVIKFIFDGTNYLEETRTVQP